MTQTTTQDQAEAAQETTIDIRSFDSDGLLSEHIRKTGTDGKEEIIFQAPRSC